MSLSAECPNCGITVNVGACPNCGQYHYEKGVLGPHREPGWVCTNCNVGFTYKICPECGAVIEQSRFEDGCFIATEIFGYDSFEVMTLRHWRDFSLRRHAIGRSAISTYYAISPTMLPFIRRYRLLRRSLRVSLEWWVAQLERTVDK